MAKAVIFDMDGVIVDTEPGYFRCINHVLGQFGCEASEELNAEFIGVTNERMWTSMIERFNLDTTVDECLKEMRTFREKMLKEEGIHPIDGTIDLIRDLHQAEIPLAVASSSAMSEIDRVMDLFEIRDCFATLASGEEVPESKPHPDIFLLAAKRLNMNPNDCLVIEDSRNGIIAAKAADMKAIGFCNPQFGLPSLPEADKEVNATTKISVELCKNM